MQKEKNKNSKKSNSKSVLDLVSLPQEEVVLVEQLEQVSKFLTYFIVTHNTTVESNVEFMEDMFEDLLQTSFMNKKHRREDFIGALNTLKGLRDITRLVNDDNVEALADFLKEFQSAIVRNNPKKAV